MLVFTVHEPPAAPPDRLDRAEQIVFVRDGFSLVATALGPFWLLFNGLWLAAAIALTTTVTLVVALYAGGAGSAWIVAVLAAIHLVIGFEGRNIERWTLARRGWSMLGSVSGRDVEECERRFFEGWLPRQPFIGHASLASQAAGSGRLSAVAEQKPSLWRRLLGTRRND